MPSVSGCCCCCCCYYVSNVQCDVMQRRCPCKMTKVHMQASDHVYYAMCAGWSEKKVHIDRVRTIMSIGPFFLLYIALIVRCSFENLCAHSIHGIGLCCGTPTENGRHPAVASTHFPTLHTVECIYAITNGGSSTTTTNSFRFRCYVQYSRCVLFV